MTITKVFAMKSQPALDASDAANVISIIMLMIDESVAADDRSTERQLQLASCIQIYHNQLHGVPTTVQEIQKKIPITANFLRKRLNRLVEIDILACVKIPDPNTGTNFSNHYALSETVIKKTMDLRV